jgi:hypothetical protein
LSHASQPANGQRFPFEGSRYTVSLPAEVVDPLSGKQIAGRTKNISRGGCFILTDGTLDIGTVVQLQIEREGITFEALAVVVRLMPGEGLAFAFLEIEPAQVARINTWLIEIAD